MSGIKGRSGRRAHYDEMLVTDVVNKSIKLVNDYISDLKIPLDKRIEVAKHFGIKAVPTKLEGEGFVSDMQVVVVRDGKEPVGNTPQAISRPLPLQQ